MVENSSSWARIRGGRRRMRSQRLVVLAVSALVGACAASAGASEADGSARLIAVGNRVGDHPAFVRAVIDFAHGTLSDNQVEAIDPQPFDGSASLRISHPMVRTRAPARTADGITVRVVQGSRQLRIDIRAPVGLFKYLAYAVVTSDRLAIDLWKTAPPSVAAELRDGRGGCLTLDRVRARAGLVSAAGTEHNLFEHQFRVLLRGTSGRLLVQRLVHAAGRWSAQLGYHATRRQTATLEAVALSAKDGALACLVQVRVQLPPSSANDALASTNAVATVGDPVPPGTSATSVTFVSSRTAFVLGTAPCARGRARRSCTSAIR